MKLRICISVFLVAALVGCMSTPKRVVASQDESQGYVDEEVEELFNNLKQKAREIEAPSAEEVSGGIKKTQEVASEVWQSRMSTALKISTLTHILDALDGAIALSERQRVSGESKVAMVSVPVSAIITMRWYSRSINHRIPALSKWKRGVPTLGKRAKLSRIPRFMLRWGLLTLVAFPVTETLLNKLGSLFVEMDREDVEALRSTFQSEIEDLENQMTKEQ